MKKYLLFVLAIGIFVTSCKNVNKYENSANNNTEQSAKIPVRIKKVERTPFAHFVETSGDVESVNWAFISPQTNGQVVKVNVDEGDYVGKGQVLVELNDAIIRKNIAELQTQLDLAKVTYEKQKSLYDQNIISEIQYLQAKTQKEALEKKLEVLNEQLSYTRVKAPFAGTVENIQIKEGEIAAPGRQLMQLYNLNKLKIKADLSEKYIGSIKKGDTVLVHFDNLNIADLKLPVYRIGSVINPNNRTFEIELRFNNKDKLIKPNMVARLKIKDYYNPHAFVVPTPLVKKYFDKNFLFVAKKVNGKLKAKKVYVKTNQTYNGYTEVVKGLHEGDSLIVEGYNEVSDNSLIEILK
jgi:membrane fusion protein (multidrug efflux system)